MKSNVIKIMSILGLIALFLPYVILLDYGGGTTHGISMFFFMLPFDRAWDRDMALKITFVIGISLCFLYIIQIIISFKYCDKKRVLKFLFVASLILNMTVLEICPVLHTQGDDFGILPGLGLYICVFCSTVGLIQLITDDHLKITVFKFGFATINAIAIMLPVFYRMTTDEETFIPFKSYESLGTIFNIIFYNFDLTYFGMPLLVFIFTVISLIVIVYGNKLAGIVAYFVLIFVDIIPIVNMVIEKEIKYLPMKGEGITMAIPIAITSAVGVIVVSVIEMRQQRRNQSITDGLNM